MPTQASPATSTLMDTRWRARSLFRIDLGPNIRAGAHYTQMSVGDFDGDGKAELAVKTAPGTKDGTGAYLSTGSAAGADNSAVYRNSSGYILTGPEWITVFEGRTAKNWRRSTTPCPAETWGLGRHLRQPRGPLQRRDGVREGRRRCHRKAEHHQAVAITRA